MILALPVFYFFSGARGRSSNVIPLSVLDVWRVVASPFGKPEDGTH